MSEVYKFVIEPGCKGDYTAELKRIRNKYGDKCPESAFPMHTAMESDFRVEQTTCKRIFDRFVNIGIVKSIEEIKIDQISKKVDNEKSEFEQPFLSIDGDFLFSKFGKWLYKDSGHYFVRIRQTGDLYYYMNGVYMPHGETYIQQIIEREVGHYVNVVVNHVSEITSYIKRMVLNEIDIMQVRSEKLACKNGVIDLRTKELLPHSPDNYMFKMIPWDYNPDAMCPNFDNLIEDLLPDEDGRYKFNMMIGYPLVNSYIYNKIFFLEGTGGSGKTTLSNIIQCVYGIDNVSNIALHDLLDEPFMREGLIDSYANFSGDASQHPIHDAALIKTLSGESRVNINLKNLRKSIKLMNCSKLIIDTNNMPEFRLSDDAIFRRIVQIKFTNVIPESEKTSNFMDAYTTKSEMEGLLCHAVDSAHEILTGDNPFKTTSIGESKEAYENSRKNIVDKFILNHIQIYPKDFDDSYEIQADVWKKFTRFCKAQNIDREQMPNVNGFYKSFLLKSGIEKPKPHWIKSMGKSVNCYHGIKVLR